MRADDAAVAGYVIVSLLHATAGRHVREYTVQCRTFEIPDLDSLTSCHYRHSVTLR
jgi:hypothetical protein